MPALLGYSLGYLFVEDVTLLFTLEVERWLIEMFETRFSGAALTTDVESFLSGLAGNVGLSDTFLLSSIGAFSGLISKAKEPLVTILLIGDGEPAI